MASQREAADLDGGGSSARLERSGSQSGAGAAAAVLASSPRGTWSPSKWVHAGEPGSRRASFSSARSDDVTEPLLRVASGPSDEASRRSCEADAPEHPARPGPEGTASIEIGYPAQERSPDGRAGAGTGHGAEWGRGESVDGKRSGAGMSEEEAGALDVHVLPDHPGLMHEVRHQLSMAWPVMVATFLQLLMSTSSLAFVGHLGETPLAAASVASAFANVIGHSVLAGLAGSLETLCGQAWGAGAPLLLGLYLQRGLICLGLAAVPLGLVWSQAEAVLLFFHQDPAIASLAGLYLRLLLPSLAANVGIQCLQRFLQAQGVTLPMALCAAGAMLLHIPLTWALVLHLGWGLPGAPVVVSISYWTNLALLLLYTCLSGVARASWGGFSMQAFQDLWAFMALALPSTAMTCLEYCAFEFLTLLAGLLPNPGLEVSALAVVLNIDYLSFVLPYGIGAAVSVRVANELGACQPQRARSAAGVGVVLGMLEVSLNVALLFSLRTKWGWAFTSSADVANYITSLAPIALFAIACDALVAVLSGIVRGCGYQQGAVVANLIAYYAVGLPLGVLLGFHYDLRTKGLFIGLVSGVIVQMLSLLLIISSSSWEDASKAAKERLSEALLSDGADGKGPKAAESHA